MYFPLVACFHLEMWSSLWWSFVGGFLVVFFCCWFCDYSLKLSYFLNFQCLCWLNIWNYMLILIYWLILLCWGWKGAFETVQSSIPASMGPVRTGCPALCTVRFWASPGMESPCSFWTNFISVLHYLHDKYCSDAIIKLCAYYLLSCLKKQQWEVSLVYHLLWDIYEHW